MNREEQSQASRSIGFYASPILSLTPVVDTISQAAGEVLSAFRICARERNPIIVKERTSKVALTRKSA